MVKEIITTKHLLNLKGRLYDFEEPMVMGVLNLTPDSFYDGGRYDTVGKIISHTKKMLDEGASIIDIGGYSSRPGAFHIETSEEIRRVVPIISTLVNEFDNILISVDTFRSEVARAAIEAGACMVNDISGGTLDSNMWKTIASFQVPYVVMHMRGTPRDMQEQTNYEDLLLTIIGHLNRLVYELNDVGIKDIIIDPGIGFAKTVEQNYEILHFLDYFKVLERPLLVGLSRKSMIYKALEIGPDDSLNGTTVLHSIALSKGADIVRVHDVKEAVQTIKLLKKLAIP